MTLMNHSLALLTTLLAMAATGQSPLRRPPAPLPPVDLTQKPAALAAPKDFAPAIPVARGLASLPDQTALPKAEVPRPVPRPFPAGTVSFAQTSDGNTWAVGDSYKASFGPAGVTFVPFFGSNAPRNWPLTLRLADAQCGTHMPLVASSAVRAERKITIDRGAFVEQYDVDAQGIEQRIVFAEAPHGGDLVLRFAIDTDLVPARDAQGLRFACELGHVGYTSAVAFDATDRPLTVETEFVDGHIVLRVPAESVERAQGGLTIDPRITAFLVRAPLPPNDIWLRPDIAHGDLQRGSALVYERAYSTADHDVYSQLCDSQGALLANTGAWININGDYWSKPRVAYQAASQQFLIVAERGPNGNALPHEIRGCTRRDVGASVSAELTFSGSEFGSKVDPVVGGDSNPRAPSYWCVVWQRNYSATDTDIHYAMVQADGTLRGGVQAIDNTSATIHYQPSISRTNGSHDERLQRWNIVFLHQVAVGDIDVWCARLNWDGTVYLASRYLDTNQTPDYNAVATTATEGDLWLACYERLLPSGDTNIVAKIMGGQGFGSGAIDLTVLENFAPSRKQRRPRVDSDGCRFAVAYEELYPVGVNDWDVLVTTFHPMPASSGFQLGVSERHIVLGNTTDLEYDVQIASAWGANWVGPAGTPQGRTRYLTTWTHASAIEGAVYEGRGGYGTWVSLPTGCGPQLGSSGSPSLGAAITLTMSGAAPSRAIFVGAPLATPIPICPGCSLGFDPGVSVVFPVEPLTLVIPCGAGFLGGQLAFQGVDFAAGGCPEGYRLSNTLIITID